MTLMDIVDRVLGFEVVHRVWPTKAYVSEATAARIMAGCEPLWNAPSELFARDQLGVAEWFVDPSLGDDDLRLER